MHRHPRLGRSQSNPSQRGREALKDACRIPSGHLKWECQTGRTQQEACKFGGSRPAQEIDAIIAYGYTTVS